MEVVPWERGGEGSDLELATDFPSAASVGVSMRRRFGRAEIFTPLRMTDPVAPKDSKCPEASPAAVGEEPSGLGALYPSPTPCKPSFLFAFKTLGKSGTIDLVASLEDVAFEWWGEDGLDLGSDDTLRPSPRRDPCAPLMASGTEVSSRVFD